MGFEAAVSKRFGDFTLEAALTLAGAETLVIVGESGAGKTTLLRLVAGLERPDRGRIAVNAAVLCDRASGIDEPPWRRPVGYVSQDYALFPHLTVFENVAFGLRAVRRPSREVRDRVARALERMQISDLAARRPRELSGGQQQRAALARALVLEPELLLLDEPLSALDLRTRQSVRGELRRLLAELTCMTVYVTHQPVEAMVFGDRIAAMEAGAVTQVGTRDDLLRHPRSSYVAAFLGVNLFRGRIVERANGVARLRSAEGDLSIVDPGGEGEGEAFAVINPREIALFRESPRGSAQNCFAGTVAELIPEPPHGERVRVALHTNPPLVAEVTDQAVVSLGLREGMEVYASFKATGIEVFR
ncbi:MAG: ABC transporter ATP-binding protein [Gemmatimonadetes bacterium]|nr:ABC transporter ATP-binding protein [Gemmatimonadota bacterium]